MVGSETLKGGGSPRAVARARPGLSWLYLAPGLSDWSPGNETRTGWVLAGSRAVSQAGYPVQSEGRWTWKEMVEKYKQDREGEPGGSHGQPAGARFMGKLLGMQKQAWLESPLLEQAPPI